jgi:hypothetical protein
MRIELDRGTGGAHDQERIIWGEHKFHQFISKSKTHIVWPIAAEDRGRLPACVALPFCWNLGVEDLKSRFRVELVADEPTGACLLRFTSLTPIGRESFSKAFVELDRSTYLPRRFVLISPDGKSTKDFRVTEVQCEQSHPEEYWLVPDVRGWNVTRPVVNQAVERWLSHLIKPDLVP